MRTRVVFFSLSLTTQNSRERERERERIICTLLSLCVSVCSGAGRDAFARVFAVVHISLSLLSLFFFSLSEEFFFPRNNKLFRKKKRERWRKSPWKKKKKKKKKNRDACGRRHRRILLRSPTGEICFSISKYSSAMRCAIFKNSLMI